MSETQDGLPQPRRALAVAAILASIVMTVLDGAMLGVALPGMARELGVSASAATWLMNAYQLTVVTTLLPLAALGESMGFRRVFLAGFGVFSLASLGSSLAGDYTTLLLCRMAQGLGSSAVMSLTAGLIRYTYPARQLGQAIGINALTVAIASSAAPTLAAAILAVGSWHWLFLVNVPVGLAGMALGWRVLPDPPGTGRRFDWTGTGLNIASFGLFFLGIDLLLTVPVAGVPLLALGLGTGWLHVRRELTKPVPLLPLDLLRMRVVATAVAASILAFAAWYASYIALPFLLQSAGRSQVETGLLMTPWPAALAVVAPVAGRLSDRMPTATLASGGMLVMAAALLVVALLPPGGAVPWLVAAIACCGIGFGFFQTPNNRTMLAAAPKARSGGAGGMQATARLLGTTLGTTVLAVAFQLAPENGPLLGLGAAVVFAIASATLSLSRRGL